MTTTDECMRTDEHDRQLRHYGSCTSCGMGMRAAAAARFCYHPLSCATCSDLGLPCGAHTPADEGHARCTGREPLRLPAREVRPGDRLVADGKGGRPITVWHALTGGRKGGTTSLTSGPADPRPRILTGTAVVAVYRPGWDPGKELPFPTTA